MKCRYLIFENNNHNFNKYSLNIHFSSKLHKHIQAVVFFFFLIGIKGIAAIIHTGSLHT
jgi:hypothetical protein